MRRRVIPVWRTSASRLWLHCGCPAHHRYSLGKSYTTGLLSMESRFFAYMNPVWPHCEREEPAAFHASYTGGSQTSSGPSQYSSSSYMQHNRPTPSLYWVLRVTLNPDRTGSGANETRISTHPLPPAPIIVGLSILLCLSIRPPHPIRTLQSIPRPILRLRTPHNLIKVFFQISPTTTTRIMVGILSSVVKPVKGERSARKRAEEREARPPVQHRKSWMQSLNNLVR